MAEWNLYCNTENSFVKTWASTLDEPTQCPNDPTHDINFQSFSLLRICRPQLIHTTILTSSSPNYVPLVNFLVPGTDSVQYDQVYPVSIKMTANVDQGSYDFRLISNDIILYESTHNTNTTPIINTIWIKDFQSVPEDEHSIDFEFRTKDGTLTLKNISIFFAYPPT